MAFYLLRLPRLTLNGVELRYTSFINEAGTLWHQRIDGTWASPRAGHHFIISDHDRPPLHVYAYSRDITWEPVPSIPAEIRIIGGDLTAERRFTMPPYGRESI